MTEEPRSTGEGKVTLEQLLRLKRSERPEASFWEDFDREFHRRQLAEVVTFTPWYARAARGAWQWTRRLAPLAGAAALVTGGFLVWNHENVPSMPAPEIAAQPTVAPAVAEAPVVHQLSPTDLSAPVAEASTSAPAVEAPASPAVGHFVIWEVASNEAKPSKFVAVTSPDTLPAPDMHAQTGDTLQEANAYRTLAYSTAVSY